MPNGSLTVGGAWLFMGAATLATVGVAGVCTWMGFWPVLPFAGLELAALGWALATSLRRSRYREVVTIGEDRICIESGMAGRGPSSRIEWPRVWTRAWLEPDKDGRPDRQLVMGRGGQRVLLGQYLTEEERKAVLGRLQYALQSGPPRMTGQSAADMTLGDG